MQNESPDRVSRRQFVKTAAAAAAVAGSFPRFVRGAAADKPLRIGLVGCGGRGTGAAMDAITADPNTKLIAMADVFKDHMENSRKRLADKGITVEDKNCFIGFDAFRKVIGMDLDYVILATPPYYRPEHFEASIKAGKHVFMEKPVCVDPVGGRRIIAAAAQAEAQNLSVMAGTQRRHQKVYVEMIKRIHDGQIGKILAANCYWNGGALWYHPRESGWSDNEWMVRDWGNWCWLSGDHIAEQHVHNIDVINWALRALPEKVVALGGRHQRHTGDQWDNFASDFVYPGGVHVASYCRQINGCANNVSEHVVGEKGTWDSQVGISTDPDLKIESPNPYVQEHADLIAAIREGKPVNEGKQVAESTLCAVMARMAAYSGQEVTWEQMMKSDLELGPPTFVLTEENIRASIPRSGKP